LANSPRRFRPSGRIGSRRLLQHFQPLLGQCPKASKCFFHFWWPPFAHSGDHLHGLPIRKATQLPVGKTRTLANQSNLANRALPLSKDEGIRFPKGSRTSGPKRWEEDLFCHRQTGVSAEVAQEEDGGNRSFVGRQLRLAVLACLLVQCSQAGYDSGMDMARYWHGWHVFGTEYRRAKPTKRPRLPDSWSV
jgi:hypothetical protein